MRHREEIEAFLMVALVVVSPLALARVVTGLTAGWQQLDSIETFGLLTVCGMLVHAIDLNRRGS